MKESPVVDREAVLFETIDALKKRVEELDGLCRAYARENRRLAAMNLKLASRLEWHERRRTLKPLDGVERAPLVTDSDSRRSSGHEHHWQ